MAMNSSRSVGGGVISTASASGVGAPTCGSPGALITDTRLRQRCGCSMAMVWAIIPPIEAPRTWARSIPMASSRPTASWAMSLSVYGTGGSESLSTALITFIGSARWPSRWVDRPQSRLS